MLPDRLEDLRVRLHRYFHRRHWRSGGGVGEIAGPYECQSFDLVGAGALTTKCLLVQLGRPGGRLRGSTLAEDAAQVRLTAVLDRPQRVQH